MVHSRNRSRAELPGEKQPSLRMAMPEDVGSLVLWLTYPAAHNVTGAAIPMDGGWTSQ
ncbi:SDR family oxidoreductase [Xanthobacter nonsaccharivorans]|uniref:SDR family oxidoreductase n=1 Tax=Xanthobacter nonsaccharivorans TaxID=3119912 RepID=UPI00372D47F3